MGRVGAGVEVVPIQLPGRESRWKEPCFKNLATLARQLAEAISPFTGTPFACFGHSMGALIAFELTRQLRREQKAGPLHLFVSACRAPHLPGEGRLRHTLPNGELLLELRTLSGIPLQLLEDAEAMQFYLPRVRADIASCASYQPGNEAPLRCPIAVFGGRDDKEVAEHELAAWQIHTDNEFCLRTYPGGHFFIEAWQTEIFNIISAALSNVSDTRVSK